MMLEILTEIEACIADVALLSAIPVHHGINPNDHLKAATFPKLVIYSQFPKQDWAKHGYSRVTQQIKLALYVKLPAKYPTDKATIASQHGLAEALRQAARNISERQVSGASTLDLDIEVEPSQEIAYLDDMVEIVTDFTVSYAE